MADQRPIGTKWFAGLGYYAVLVILALGLCATAARAHRMLVFAFPEGDTIQVESKFVPDTPVHQGKVLVLDQKTDQELMRGQTDDQGKFSFEIPAQARAEKMDLKIVVESTLGHRGEWLLQAGNYLPGAPPAPAKAAEPAPAAAPAPKASETQTVNLDQQALEAALQKTLERELAPIQEKLTELTLHRTSLTDVIGGLGYIMGLFGLWAYMQSRKRKDS